MSRRVVTLCLIAILLSLAGATPLYVLSVAEGADPTCVQPTYETSKIPFTVPSGAIVGDLLPGQVSPVTAPVYIVPTGAYSRTARVCDPDGDPIASVKLVSGTTPATVTYSANTGMWTLGVANLPAGIHAFVVEAIDAPTDGTAPKSRKVTVLLKAERPNQPPSLF